jgi:hypothetical protein
MNVQTRGLHEQRHDLHGQRHDLHGQRHYLHEQQHDLHGQRHYLHGQRHGLHEQRRDVVLTRETDIFGFSMAAFQVSNTHYYLSFWTCSGKKAAGHDTSFYFPDSFICDLTLFPCRS